MYLTRFINKLWRPLLNLLTPEHASTYADFSAKTWLMRRLRVKIGSDVAVGRNFDFFIGQGRLYLDHHINISNDVAIYAFKEISIGAFTAIASHCLFTDGGHDLTNHLPKSTGLKIGRGVFIGSGARIVGSVTVGDNALIAAGAVVLSDVPEGTVMAGNPARKIGRRPLAKAVWHFPDTWYDHQTFEIVATGSTPPSAK